MDGVTNCDKKIFITKKEAKQFIKKHRIKHPKSFAADKIYRCSDCNFFHLTTHSDGRKLGVKLTNEILINTFETGQVWRNNYGDFEVVTPPIEAKGLRLIVNQMNRVK